MDGALSNNMPLFEHTNTITMAPFSGESDISPREEAFNPVMVHCCNLSIQVNTRNIHRICTSFLPPTLEVAPPAGSLYSKTCNWVHLLKASVTLSFFIQFFTVVFLQYGAKLNLSWCFPEEFNTDLITNRSRQNLAEICHSGYMDALRFLKDHGESFHLCPPFHLLLTWVHMLEVCLGQIWLDCSPAGPSVWWWRRMPLDLVVDRSLTREITAGWTPRS